MERTMAGVYRMVFVERGAGEHEPADHSRDADRAVRGRCHEPRSADDSGEFELGRIWRGSSANGAPDSHCDHGRPAGGIDECGGVEREVVLTAFSLPLG